MAPFHKILRIWFEQNKRVLPWRQDNAPYLVWISEIILQQTRVEQGLPWYKRFIERFPDVKNLAEASEEDVLLIWQGLGYYSRARNLHFAARQIMNQYQGVFPNSYEKIKNLKGIGGYTASAIASISFGLPHAVLDGNVYRVLSRIFGISTPIDCTAGKKEFAILAYSLLDKKDPGSFNEGMMDFGAILCKPQHPLCSDCPFENSCEAFKNGRINQLPVKSKRAVQRNRYFYYLFIKYNDSFYLHKREGNDIWKNMYQFPLIETTKDYSEKELFLSEEFKEIFKNRTPIIQSVSPEFVHNLSHQKLHIRIIRTHLTEPLGFKECFPVTPENSSLFPLPKPINNFIEKEIKKSV